jgi:hypothetical protein
MPRLAPVIKTVFFAMLMKISFFGFLFFDRAAFLAFC